MTAIVAVETVLLVLLLVLVAGLLRSHAEILRRLGPAADAGPLPRPPRGVRTGADVAAAPLTGSTPAGEPVTLAFAGPGSLPTLLAFLTSGCSTCQGFWDTLGERRLPPGMQTVIVTHGSDRESPSKIRGLAPEDVPVVMSSPAWEDYRVPGSPYFVLVDGVVRGEGVATTWQALSSMISDAIEDELLDVEVRRSRGIDETFAAAGIGPEHPSLRPGGPGQ